MHSCNSREQSDVACVQAHGRVFAGVHLSRLCHVIYVHQCAFTLHSCRVCCQTLEHANKLMDFVECCLSSFLMPRTNTIQLLYETTLINEFLERVGFRTGILAAFKIFVISALKVYASDNVISQYFHGNMR